jgi:hypothetical protein
VQGIAGGGGWSVDLLHGVPYHGIGNGRAPLHSVPSGRKIMSAPTIAGPAAAEGGRKYLEKCHAIIGGEFDKFGAVWADMPEQKRRFWLHYSRLPERYSTWEWSAIPGESRAIMKNNLYRGAVELQSLLTALQ